MLEIQKYVNEKRQFYAKILLFIESDYNWEEDLQNLIKLVEMQKINKSKDDLKAIIHLIVSISNNHQRNSNFFYKIEQILSILIESIKQTYSNTEIFNFFKSNNRILLFLFEKQIISIDQSIVELILESDSSKRYFFNEIKNLISSKKKIIIGRGLLKRDLKIFENFDEKRKDGLNDSYICSLIRNDLVEEFIAYVNRNSISLESRIKSSIFETNSFLIDKEPLLIEYAAFYGSIQIFTYLKLNNVELTPSLWFYTIHSNNAELIHILEENNVIPNDKSYEKCFEESIKCHHNDIANYIKDNLLDKNIENENLNENFYQNELCYSFHYYNFEFIPDDFNSNKFIFHYLCKYDYFYLVKLFIQAQKMFLNLSVVLNINIFFIELYLIFYQVSIYFLLTAFKIVFLGCFSEKYSNEIHESKFF